MKTAIIAAALSAMLATPLGADPVSHEPLYRATHDPQRNRYCVVRMLSPSGPARPIDPGPRCLSKLAWQDRGLRIEHRAMPVPVGR